MKILELMDLRKKDLAVDYRKIYTATAVLEIQNTKVEKKIEINIEHSPLGHIEVNVALLEALDYPLVPVLRLLKSHVHGLHEKGLLS